MKDNRIIDSSAMLIEAYLKCQLPEYLHDELWNRIAVYPDVYNLFIAHIHIHKSTAEAKVIYNMEKVVRDIKTNKTDFN
jgi:hypothetical protein